jgi:hypothetical protein
MIKQVQYHFGAKVAYMENGQLYVKANSFGLRGGEQPKNIVNMGCYQLSNGSIWRIDVHAEPQIVPPVEESFGPVNIEIGEGEVARIPGTFIIHDEVGDTVPTQKQIDQLRSNAKLAAKAERDAIREQTAKAGAKLAADMGPGTYSVYLDGNRIDVPVSEETTAKEIATAINEKAGYDFASVAPVAADLKKAYAQGAGTSYADTPTGTVAWDDMTGNMRRRLLENGVPLKYRFCDALHLVPDGDFLDVACPVCGGDNLETSALLETKHVSGLFEGIDPDDQEIIDELEDGVACFDCHHHLKYDFENETVTIRRGE